MITSAIIRRVVYIAVAAIVSLCAVMWSETANACPVVPEMTPPPGGTFAYVNEARQACEAAGITQSGKGLTGFKRQFIGCISESSTSFRARFKVTAANVCPASSQGAGTESNIGGTYSGTTLGCPPGSVWNEQTKTCHDPEVCLARNQQPGFLGVGPTTRSFEVTCAGGCEFKAEAGSPQVCTGAVGSSDRMCTATFRFSGNACAVPPGQPAPDAPPPPKDRECILGTDAETKVCQGKDGRQCYVLKGAEMCWGVGETGEKANGPEQQQRDAGPTPQPPRSPPLPPETFAPGQASITTTTTTVINNITNVTTTTTTGRTTTNGTTPPGDPGKPGTPVPGQEPDGQENESSGGGSCEDPPVVFGDEALRQIADQAWATRCAVEAGNAVKVTGDIADCDQPFTVEENVINPEDKSVETMKALRASICPLEGTTGSGYDDSALGGDADGTGSGFIAAEGEGTGGSGLDQSGLGFSRTCPVIPAVMVMGTSIQLDNSKLCEWLQLGSLFVLALAALTSLKIMMGGP